MGEPRFMNRAVLRATTAGLAAMLALGALIVVRSRNLSHFDAALASSVCLLLNLDLLCYVCGLEKG